MFVAISVFLLVNYIQSTEIPAQQNRVARLTGEEFANAITLAVKGGTGFVYNYTFTRTIMNSPYVIHFQPGDSNTIIIEWTGAYGNFSYSYPIPAYEYKYGGCVSDKKLVSSECSNTITLVNNGSALLIKQFGD